MLVKKNLTQEEAAFLKMVKGLVRAAEMIRERDRRVPGRQEIWDDEIREAFEHAIKLGWGYDRVGLYPWIDR